jgi:hypothetical protein
MRMTITLVVVLLIVGLLIAPSVAQACSGPGWGYFNQIWRCYYDPWMCGDWQPWCRVDKCGRGPSGWCYGQYDWTRSYHCEPDYSQCYNWGAKYCPGC